MSYIPISVLKKPPFGGARSDLAEALASVDSEVKADIELQRPFSINQIFARPCHEDVPSRVVLDFA